MKEKDPHTSAHAHTSLRDMCNFITGTQCNEHTPSTSESLNMKQRKHRSLSAAAHRYRIWHRAAQMNPWWNKYHCFKLTSRWEMIEMRQWAEINIMTELFCRRCLPWQGAHLFCDFCPRRDGGGSRWRPIHVCVCTNSFQAVGGGGRDGSAWGKWSAT